MQMWKPMLFILDCLCPKLFCMAAIYLPNTVYCNYLLQLVRKDILSKNKIEKCLGFTLNVILSRAGKPSPSTCNAHSAPIHLLLIIFLKITLGSQDTKPTTQWHRRG